MPDVALKSIDFCDIINSSFVVLRIRALMSVNVRCKLEMLKCLFKSCFGCYFCTAVLIFINLSFICCTVICEALQSAGFMTRGWSAAEFASVRHQYETQFVIFLNAAIKTVNDVSCFASSAILSLVWQEKITESIEW